MELIADILLVAGALGAGLYCFVLARRLKRFTDLEKGVGGAVSVLSAQAGELRNSLDSARAASDRSGAELRDLTQRAESVAQRLELMMASMHDLVPDQDEMPKTPEEPEPPSVTEAEIAADAEPQEQPETTEPAERSKVPDGLMFFRHARPQNGAAT